MTNIPTKRIFPCTNKKTFSINAFLSYKYDCAECENCKKAIEILKLEIRDLNNEASK